MQANVASWNLLSNNLLLRVRVPCIEGHLDDGIMELLDACGWSGGLGKQLQIVQAGTQIPVVS